MRKVWTRRRAAAPAAKALPLVRRPVPERPQIHQIELPLPGTASWGAHATQVYLIEGDPLTLVDSGIRSEASHSALAGALDQLGYGLAEIERVVITHAHRDHYGLVETLRRLGADLECCVHEADARTVEQDGRIFRQRVEATSELLREFGVPPALCSALEGERLAALEVDAAEAEPTRVDRRLSEGDRIATKDFTLRVHHSPGHSPGHLLLEDEETGTLFTGDQVMGRAVPQAENFYLGVAVDPSDPAGRRPRFRGLVELRRSLRALRRRHFRRLLPGDAPAIERSERAIRDTLLYYDVRIQRIDRGLRQLRAMGQEVTAHELWQALYPDREHRTAALEIRAQLLTVIGALDCLEDDGLVETVRRSDGVLIHHHR
jgi:glyoxylase-like metal-dependent hydrolase (beta-lactamase superfamily II)